MPRRLQDLVVFAAPAVFVVLWATGFIGAKFGLPYAEPLTFLALRMGTVVVLLGAILSLTRPKWPGARGVAHSAVTGLLVHGLGLGGVFVAIGNGLSAGMVALVLSLQPALTSTIASRWLGERVRLLQWVGLALGLFGIYLIVRDKATTGSATPFAWAASAVGLLGITVGTLYQKRFGGEIDWRPALCVQYAAAGLLFAFGAAVFERGTGRLVAVGVNSVVRLRSSVLHGEMMAFILAQERTGSFSLAAPGLPAHELATSCEPCAMCLGATLWSGVKRLVFAAHREDAEDLGFDEGPVFAASYQYLRERGIEIVGGLLREEARAVFTLYRSRGGLIYNA